MIFSRWSIRKVKKRLLQIDHVYDVMYEAPLSHRYLFHIWVNNLNECVRGIIEPQIKEAMRGRPREIKVDVLIYRRDTE